MLDKIGIKINGLIIGILFLLVLSGSISHALAFENSQLQWTQGISGELQHDETLSYMGYSVKAVAFPPPVESDRYKTAPKESVDTYVGLEISKNGNFLETVLLGSLESYILPDGEIKVMVKQLPSSFAEEWLFESYNPWVVVEMESRGIPSLDISIQADNGEDVSSFEIPVTVTLKNNGNADAVNVDMEILTDLPILRGELKYHYNKVGKGASITEQITFTKPKNKEQETYQIAANVAGYDVKDISYSAKALNNILVSGETEQCLSIRKSTTNKIYLKDMAIVSLSVKNSGNCNLKNVTIRDSVPVNIRLIGNHTLNWLTDVPAYGEWDYTYLIKAREPNKNGLVLPSASAKYWYQGNWNTIQSNQPKIIVYGPKIVLSKQVDVSGVTKDGNVKVTVSAENTGSTPTKLTIFDNISGNITLISDVKAYENSHESDDKTRFGYTYRVAECTESVIGITAYEEFIGSTNKYNYWIAECTESVNGIAAYEEFIEANSKISFSYTISVNTNESFKLPNVSAQYYELGNKGDKIYTETQGPGITIIHPEEIKVNETPVETPTPVPTPMAIPSPTINQSENNLTNESDGYNIFRNNEFFLNYMWSNSNASFLNKSVRESDNVAMIQNESNNIQNISNTTASFENNTIVRFFSYIKNTLFGGMNGTESNQSTQADSNVSVSGNNDTSGNETNESTSSGNNTISDIINYFKNAFFGRINETEVNQSTQTDSNVSLPENNKITGNETNTSTSSGNNTISNIFNYFKNALFGGMNDTEVNQSNLTTSNFSSADNN